MPGGERLIDLTDGIQSSPHAFLQVKPGIHTSSIGIHTTFEGRHIPLWRAGLPRVGVRSSPKSCLCAVSGTPHSPFFGGATRPNAGQARSPQQPICHRFCVRRCLWTSGGIGLYTTFEGSHIPRWRAGLPRVGVRSSPKSCLCGVSGTPHSPFFGGATRPNAGQARSPQQPMCHRFCVRRCLWTSGGIGLYTTFEGCHIPLWRAGLSRVGVRSSPKSCLCGVSGTPHSSFFGGATRPNAGQARSPQQPICHRFCVRRCLWTSGGIGLYTTFEGSHIPLWRAGLPRVGLRSSPKAVSAQYRVHRIRPSLGALRAPTRGKPARHNSRFVTDFAFDGAYGHQGA